MNVEIAFIQRHSLMTNINPSIIIIVNSYTVEPLLCVV